MDGIETWDELGDRMLGEDTGTGCWGSGAGWGLGGLGDEDLGFVLGEL